MAGYIFFTWNLRGLGGWKREDVFFLIGCWESTCDFMLSCLFWFAVRLYESRWYNPQKWLSEGPFSSKTVVAAPSTNCKGFLVRFESNCNLAALRSFKDFGFFEWNKGFPVGASTSEG